MTVWHVLEIGLQHLMHAAQALSSSHYQLRSVLKGQDWTQLTRLTSVP
jgi:hypothetical protein